MSGVGVALVLVWGPLADDWAGLVDTGAAARGPGRDQAPVWGAAAVCGNVSPGTSSSSTSSSPASPTRARGVDRIISKPLRVKQKLFPAYVSVLACISAPRLGVADLVLVP